MCCELTTLSNSFPYPNKELVAIHLSGAQVPNQVEISTFSVCQLVTKVILIQNDILAVNMIFVFLSMRLIMILQEIVDFSE